MKIVEYDGVKLKVQLETEEETKFIDKIIKDLTEWAALKAQLKGTKNDKSQAS